MSFREMLAYINNNFMALLTCNFLIAASTFSAAIILLTFWMPQLVDATFVKDIAKFIVFVYGFYSVMCWVGLIFRREK